MIKIIEKWYSPGKLLFVSSLIREQTKTKNHYYERKINELKNKYGLYFKGCEKVIVGRKEEEIFAEWDDFMQWENYDEALRYWTEAE